MTIKAAYTSPPPAVGTVTLTIDEGTAQKLRALLGNCTTDTFSPVWRALSDVLPNDGRLAVRLGKQPDGARPNDPPVISLGVSYGAQWIPTDH